MRLVSWPMYATAPDATALFGQELRAALADHGFDDTAPGLVEPGDLMAHWRDPSLLLSQTCGYPFATGLTGAVRYVATPRFRAPGCDEALYSSAVVVRRDEAATTVAALAGRRAAFNSRDSQSGYNSLRALVAPLAQAGRFFDGLVETGAHRQSVAAVASGAADVAAIDAVTLALVGDHEPQRLAALRVLCWTPLTPGLPLITAARTSDSDLLRLRQVVRRVCCGDTPATRAMRLDGATVLPPDAYARLVSDRDHAEALGYPELG